MTAFKSEAEMQSWLEQKINSGEAIGDLISNLDYLDGFSPQGIKEKIFLESFKSTASSLYITNFISADENLSLAKGDILRPDLLLYSPETEGIIIVELKNFSGATREAGTEIAAYTAEVKSYLPFISNGDVFAVVVSPSWPALLKHYVSHEILWNRRNILCLEPTKIGENIQLKIVEIQTILSSETNHSVAKEHITGYQLCLYDYELYTKNANRARLDKHINQMEAALTAIAHEGNKLGDNGFAFLWKDNWSESLAPYSISIFNMAPFTSIERFLHFSTLDSMSEMQRRFLDLVLEEDPTGHGHTLNEITLAGNKFLEPFCEPRQEGFTDWVPLKEIMNSRATFLAFGAWGLFGDVFMDKLKKEYASGNYDVKHNCPTLGLATVETLIDEHYTYINPHYLSYAESDL